METKEGETRLDIVVVGGSLSGLIHGLVLKRIGHNVVILERSQSMLLAEQGAGLGVPADLEAFMREYDVIQEQYMLTPPSASIVDSQGDLLLKSEPGIRATSWSTLYYRLRANFDCLKSDHCDKPPPDNPNAGQAIYLYGHTVLDVKKEDGRLIVDYHNNDGTRRSLVGDLVIAADGAGSKIRQKMEPQIKRQYVGYCAWRGTILEQSMEQETKSLCRGNDRHCKVDRSLFLSYTIPGQNGSLDADKRLRNWVWYCNYAEDSEELREIMTDCQINHHRFFLPPGRMREQVWKRQKRLAQKLLDPHSAELIQKTEQPFIQTVTEALSPRASFLDGKLLLVGDALAILRPLSGQGTNQAARSAFLLRQVLEGRMSIQEWEKSCLDYAQDAFRFGIDREKSAELGLRYGGVRQK